MATPIGFEPTISCVTGRRFKPLSYGAMSMSTQHLCLNPQSPPNMAIASTWWAMTGSNRRHPACKAGALPAELITRGLTTISIHNITHRVKAIF